MRIGTVLIATGLAAACSGTIEHPDSRDGTGEGGDLVAPECTTVGPPMLRRLSSVQWENSLASVFGEVPSVAESPLTDPPVHGYRVDATASVIRDSDTYQIMLASESIASWAVSSKLSQLSSCQELEPGCIRSFIESFGAKVYREAVPEASIQAYEAMFAEEATFAEGAEVVIATMLQSPYFLYRREIGVPTGGGRHELTSEELASSLSYMLTDAPPDEALLQAVESGQLAGPEDLEREMDRLLASPASEATLARFVYGWLEVEDLPQRAKDDPTNAFTDGVRNAMLDETRNLFLETVRSGGSISELFLSETTTVSGELANYYQMGFRGEGQPIPVAEGMRAQGVLGHGSVLARHALPDSSSPVQRGKLVRERFLCQELQPPPPNVDASLSDTSGATTTRERYALHSESDACRGCHVYIDPIGFAFENFDGFGKFRTEENGQPIDSSGALTLTNEQVPLMSVNDLSRYLATSEQVEACVIENLSYYSYGLEGCSEEAIHADVEAGDSSLRSMLLAIIQAPHFREREVP